ncbi:MAG: helix-turn-helix transcriptional regulator [Janthinobacterium lividum]
MHTLQRSTLAMVVIRYGGAGTGAGIEQASDALIPENAHTFGWYHRGAIGTHCVSSDRKLSSPRNDGQTSFCFLPELDFLRLTTPCIAQHFVITSTFVDELVDDLEARPISRIGDPELAVDDPLLANFGSRLLDFVGSPEELDVLSADQVMMSLAVYVCGRYGGLITRRPSKGSLTRWQVRLAQELINANLSAGVPLKTLAQACGLRTSQFAHAFKRSVGIAPHQWLISRRLDRARSLMRDGNLPLADVALTCGFADQSHLTRTFRRHEGIAPSVWHASAQRH